MAAPRVGHRLEGVCAPLLARLKHTAMRARSRRCGGNWGRVRIEKTRRCREVRSGVKLTEDRG